MGKHILSVDIETFSDIDIRKAGSYKYALSPNFDILLIAYAVDDDPVQIIDCTEAGGPMDDWMMDEFMELMQDEDYDIHAYNASFEYWCFHVWFTRKGLNPIPVSRYRCTMVHGLYCGYTAGLGVTGEVLGIPQDKKKLSVGSALIRKFCVPSKPTIKDPHRNRIYPHDEPEKWELFKKYCINDVEAERAIETMLSCQPMPETEQKLWELDVISNSKGVLADMDMVLGAIELNARKTERLTDEAKRISGLENPNSVAQLTKWVNDNGEDTETLRKADVADILGRGASNENVQRMLEIRQQLGKTSCKKYEAIVNCACEDGRIRGVTQYYAANRSGRYGGRLVQLQNCPQNHIEPLDYARELVKDRDGDALEMWYGDNLQDTLSQLFRTALIPPKGMRYVIADFSAIECRVLAFLADQNSTLDVFRNGGDIYCATASEMFHVPVGKHGPNGHLRQKGKIATLACGYGGGTGAMEAMGAVRMGIDPDDLQDIVDRWRAANPLICALWTKADKAARKVIETGEAQYLPRGIVFRRETDPGTGQDWMTIELPSGRKLFYAHPGIEPAPRNPNRKEICYRQQNQITRKWEKTFSWGGKIVENITQAVSRDLLTGVLTRLYDAGHTPIFHVHDEVIIEVPEAEADAALALMLKFMSEPPEWADRWQTKLPLKGAGFISEFYMKD